MASDAASTHDVEVLDQNRAPVTTGRLEISGSMGVLQAERPLTNGVFFLRFPGGGVRSVRLHQPLEDGRLPVESRDYPYRLEAPRPQ